MIKGESARTEGKWRSVALSDVVDGDFIQFTQAVGLLNIDIKDENGCQRVAGQFSQDQAEAIRDFLDDVLDDWEDAR
jgi:hypothetical protein